MGNDIEIRVRVANQTQSGVASVRQSIVNGLRGARTAVPVTVDDQTAPGLARVNAQLRRLRSQSPIRLALQLDDRTGRLSSLLRDVRQLHTAADNASGALTGLAARATLAAVALARLAASAEDATREINNLRSAASRAATAVGRLGSQADDADGRLSNLTSTTAHLTIQMGDLGGATRDTGGDLRSLRGDLGRLTISAGGAANAFGGGGGGMGLRGQLIGAAAALGTSLLPTIGAVAPMLSGLTVVAGGGALALDDLKKKAKQLKPAFEEWQKVATKAVAPHTEKAVKSLKSAMEDLNPVIKTGADTFGRITEKAARFVDSPAFQASFAKNAEMGAKWVEEFGSSIGDFTTAFLDFGTKSQPALDAWQELLGGFLDTGLPGMFQEMERGVGGSSDVLSGLASLINDSLLPTLGKVAGSFAEAFGPLLKEMFIGAGHAVELFGELFSGAMKTLEAPAKVAADIFRGLNEVFEIGASVAGDLAGALGGALLGTIAEFAGTGDDVEGMTGGFSKFSDWVKENQTTIRVAFTAMGMAIIDMVNIGIQSIPMLMGAFQGLADMVLTSIDTMISGLASAFGDVPVIGDLFKDANEQFDEMAGGFREKLGGMTQSAADFAEVAGEKLGRAKLVLNVDQAKANLEYIKEELKDPNLTETREAKLKADKSQAEAALADAKQRLKDFDGKKATANVGTNLSGFLGGIATANKTNPRPKSVSVGANLGPFRSAVGGIAGRVVGTSYINVAYRQVGSAIGGAVLNRADGGILNFYANGGVRNESHVAQIAPAGSWRVWGEPETGGEAYIPLAPAKRSRSREVAEQTVGMLGGDVQWFAKGGVTKAEREARKAATGNLTISHFGQMAGYKTSEIIGQLARADSLNSLVGALNNWRNIIMKATHGGVEKSLLRSLDSAGRKLLNWEKQLSKATSSLEKSKARLDELKQAASALRESVQSGVLSSANITRRQGDGPVTVASVMGGLTASRDKSTSFAKALADLQKKGLSSALIQQIAEAGIEGGGLETAGALLKASSSEIKSMNQLQTQITAAATAAGKTTADAVYASQIKTQEKLVKAWQTTTDKLTKSMENLAKSMEKLIEKGFKGKAGGGIVGAAASGGLRSNLTWVGEHGPELLDLPVASRVWSNPDSKRMQQSAWTSMLNTPRLGHAQGRGAVVGRGGGSVQPIIVHQTITLDGRVVAQQIFDPLRKEIAAKGGNVQRSLGQGAG
ncbi:hypothetical protein ACGFNY_05135 [Streptomyces chartreusis]|uniref:hypothetical protein n=1 Tax=Streptomyces chartreusis TaxID=1969 RepID=UPI00371EF347